MLLNKLTDKYKILPIQIKASLWFLVCAFMQKGISVISTPIFTRLFTTEEFGRYNVFNSWMGIITVFVSLNLSYGVYAQGMVKFEDERKQFVSSLQGLCLTLVLIWTAIYLLFHDFWNGIFSLTTVQMLAMLTMIWTSTAFNFWSVEQRIDLKYRKLVIVTVMVSVAKPVLGVLLVIHARDKVTARILGLVLVELIGYTAFFFSQMYRGKKFYYGKFWKYALLFNIPLIPHYLSQTVLNSADRIMISNMVGEDVAGIYSLAYSVSSVMTLFNVALTQTMEPWLYRKIKEKKVEDISKIAYPAFILIAAVNVILIAFAPEIVSVFAPLEYHDAIWVIPPIAMSVYFMFAYIFFAAFEFYYEKTKYISIATILGAVLNILLNYIFIDIFGYFAAGYTTLICYIAYAMFHYCFMRKICRDYLEDARVYSTKVLFGITAGFMILGFLFLFTYYNMILRYSLITVFFILIFVKRKSVVEMCQKLITIKKSGDIDKSGE